MKTYFDDGQIQIIHGDCRDYLPTIAPDSIDLVLTDPPYGIALSNHGNHPTWSVIGDHSQEIGSEAINHIRSLGIPVIAFANPMKPWPGEWRQHLVWDKGGAVGGGGDIATCWKFTWELIQVAGTGRLNGPRDNAVLSYPMTPQDSSLHPCQKPVGLLRYLIGKATPADALVVDLFGGSGTTARAAKDLGRRCILVEIDERNCETAARRLEQQVLNFGDAA